ncbi:MAG: FAD-binding oxidoreductase, partial [Thermodesulfobacteriota bacterium]|nr:FAD-binding oxidoreductase [Thermodesulfobacteriota bacterium]
YEGDTGYGKTVLSRPGCVILPNTTEETQKIVRTCNRFKIPFIPTSSRWGELFTPHRGGLVYIDLKRMDNLEIDEKNMYALVEPGVIFSQLQEQAMRRGLYITVPGGGAQVSVVGNHISFGFSPLNYRNCIPSRRVLGVEWILPDGEILRLGSLASQDDPFWGSGPGPDLRGILRGHTPGWLGALGVVSRMAVKLFPFQPEVPQPSGISPHTTLQLPPNRMRWINFTMPNRDSLVQAMLEIGKAEIGAAATKVPLFWRIIAKAKSKEEFWELWSKENKESVSSTHILRVLLIGYTCEEQLDHEEAVLMEIIGELGGEARRTRPTDESWIKNADSAGMWWMCGGYVSAEYDTESLRHAVKQGEAFAELKKKYTPPLMPDYGDPGWFQIGDLGHTGYCEFLIYYDPSENTDGVDQYYVETAKLNAREGFWTAFIPHSQPVSLTGPKYGPNYHFWLAKIKDEFDPNRLSNPPIPFGRDQFMEKAEWMKGVKDWETDPKTEELIRSYIEE